MLVLSRKLAESVVLKFKSNDTEKEVRIKVINIGTNKVRLGFETESDVTILREELLDRDEDLVTTSKDVYGV